MCDVSRLSRAHTFWFKKALLIGPLCSPPARPKTRKSPRRPPVLDAQFSFDKCDVSVKLLMRQQDSASQTSKGIH